MSALWTEDKLDLDGTALPVRVYRAGAALRPTPLVLHLHGGTFTCGDLDCGAMICRTMAEAGAVVVSIDYPLAPEHPFPAALNVSFAALDLLYRQRARWAGRGARLFVAGEEAGANIATALTLMARDQHRPPIAGQILISPMLDPCLGSHSIRAAAVGEAGCKWADGWHFYLGTADKAAHPYAAPLGSRRLAGIAPALILTSDDCPMHDESVEYGQRLGSCGVPVQSHVVSDPSDWPPDGPPDAASLPPWAQTLLPLFTTFLTAPAPAAAVRTVQA
ncbi:acetyl esterase/lipase [Angulomicrobium tetraedrale]|uniref:Acetyl esterase/lipase n=1 Tax=Ancylobacter tetraedralis TaxID=217068 RepID=A0A839Z1Y3_9HYPH|nr:alpha/beta hydrolase [Ancylobacter tetraedralis]MBB3769619.1 acetyl esterase/lipase [Ancylobacter tetraedralis]